MEPVNSFGELSRDLADAVASAGQFVAAVHARPHTPSSGVVWREGVIVTADHVVRQEEDITVRIAGGPPRPARLVGRDPGSDLAVLQFEGESAGPRFGDTASLRVGNLALALGRGSAAALAMISGLEGPGRTWRGGQIEQLIRLDVSILLGFSGGALVAPGGELLGVTTSGLLRGIGAALPVTTVDRVVDRLLKRGDSPRGYLGIGMQPVRIPAALGNKVQPPASSGIILLTVEPGSPADLAGLMVGDVVVALDGKPLTDPEDLQTFLEPEAVGKTYPVGLLRGGAPLGVQLTVGARPQRGA